MRLVFEMFIFDVIFENCIVENMVGPGQTPRVIRGVWSEPAIFFAHEHLKLTFCPSAILTIINVCKYLLYNE